MLSKFIISLIILYNIFHISALKSSNICRHREKNCDQCEKLECFGKHKFECGTNYCATDFENCGAFHNQSLNILKVLISPAMYQYHNRRYEMFTKKIKFCPKKVYTWTKKDTCIHKNYNTNTKKICGSTKNYICGKRFCSIHKYACKAFLEIINKNPRVILEIGNCEINN
jgi:hypothetical protein